MTTFTRTTAVALTIGMISGLVYFAPTFAKELGQVSGLEVSALDSETGRGVGSVAASHKVRCIMPPAWRQACDA